MFRMQKIGFAIAIGLLAGCAVQEEKAAESASSVRSGYVLPGTKYIDVYRSPLPLSDAGKRALIPFFTNADLADLLPVTDNAWNLTPELCEQMYARYNLAHPDAKLNEESCRWNIRADGVYEEYGLPIHVILKEIEQAYLFLSVTPDGYGMPPMLIGVHDIVTGKTTLFDTAKIKKHQAVGYDNGAIYFYSTGFETGEEPSAVSTIDVKTQTLQ